MQPSNLTWKLIAPIVPEALLHRRALLKKLHHALIESSPQYKLSLICAPAGYGKSTLLADFVSQSPISYCWYTLDQTDRDQHTFLRNLVASIRYRFPSFGPTLDQLIAHSARNGMHYGAGASDPGTIIDSIVEAITREITDPFLLFLANYHEVNEANAINQLVDRLIQLLPTFCSVVIESRGTPSLKYAFLLAQRQIFALSTIDFQFTAQEIKELAAIQGVTTLTEAEIEQFITYFDGWIVGILLGTRLGDMQFLQTYQQNQETPHAIELLIDQETLFEYLVQEVLGRKPEMYQFLGEAVVLQQMSPILCASLLDIEVSEVTERLGSLEVQGLFVSHYEEKGQIVYLCHPVLRDILCKVLYTQRPERFFQLHQQAAHLFYSMQDYESAMYHALALEDSSFAINLIIEIHERLIAEGNVETVARWIGKLPQSVTASHPLLLLIEARVSTILGDQAHALDVLIQATELEQELHLFADQAVRFRADVAIVRSRALFQAGEYVQSREGLREILASVPAKESALHAEAHTLLGISANVQGNIKDGIVHLQHALQYRGREKATRHVIDLHSMLASSYSLMGNFLLAEHHLSRALTLWKDVPDEYERVFLLMRMGLIKQRQGLYNEAEESFLQALAAARKGARFLRGEAYTLVNLGELYQEQEQYHQSLEILEDGLRLSRQIQDMYLTRGSLRTLAITYMFMGDAATALLILTEAEHLSDQNRDHTIEDVQLMLTRGTIFLYMQRYEEALQILYEAKEAFSAAHLKQDVLRATLRLADCQYGLQNDVNGDTLLQEVILHIRPDEDYERLLRFELKHLPHILARITAQEKGDPVEKLLQWRIQEKSTVSSSTAPVILTNTNHQIKIQAFGEPAIFVDDVMITHWRRAKAMELFFYLLDKKKAVRKDQIIDDLWPEWDTINDQAFRSTVHSLRKIVGEKSVVSGGGHYSLDLTTSFRHVLYDVELFLTYEEQVKTTLSGNNYEQAEKCLRAMIALYQGDYVQSFYSNWCLFQRDVLGRINMDAYGKLATLCFQQERWNESISLWEQIITRDPYQEEAHYGLMRCYARMGQRSYALRQYQHYAQLLQDELSASPSTTVQSFYQQLVKSESDPQN
ncbi:transcriptional activator [Dictyobacter alpinus]|uniref:Transcriptional activator n=1 Tax=Dictyobacter alpinus TaxID=2014873 RepID=A0A402B8G2_9CHLR|nr:BTAD domain-containing putative transcriptional regulator [Dictyobacter alpinus]GCE27619.1 transcriptional activator [Dictyobacter alpinus]